MKGPGTGSVKSGAVLELTPLCETRQQGNAHLTFSFPLPPARAERSESTGRVRPWVAGAARSGVWQNAERRAFAGRVSGAGGKPAWSALPRDQTNVSAPAAGCDLQTRPAPQERGASLVCRAARCRRSMVAESTSGSRCAPIASTGRGGRDPDAWWRAACRLGAVATLAARGQPTFPPAAPGGSESSRIRRVSPVHGSRGPRGSSRPSAPDGLDERSAEGRVSPVLNRRQSVVWARDTSERAAEAGVVQPQ